MELEQFIIRLKKVRRVGDRRYMACCPSHNDTNPSLSVSHVKGKILLKCWSGCGAADVVQSMGLRLHDLFDEPYEADPLAFGRKYINRDMHSRKGLEAAKTAPMTISRAKVVIDLAKQDRERGKTLTKADLATELEALDMVRRGF